MKYRIDDPKIFEILKRNHITYWPDVRSYGSDLVLSRGMSTMLRDGSMLENRNGKLVLTREGTPPPAGLARLEFLRRCETGWNSPREDEWCCNMTRWQYNGDAICIACMRRKAAMMSDNAEAFQPAFDQEMQ